MIQQHRGDQAAIGVGIIGAGLRGIDNLGSRILETADETGFRVVALCDIREDRLREARDQLLTKAAERGIHDPITLYTDYRALIADPRVHLVVVTTRQDFHRPPALAALAAGKRLYLDKPIAHNLEDAVAIVEAEARYGKPMILGFTRRYESAWRRADELVQEGVIGDLHLIQIRSIIPYDVYFHRWHRRREWSGGALNDKSSHHMDVFNWFAGSRAVRISAFGGRRVFLPDPEAPARCLECDRECPYRVTPHRGELGSQDRLALLGTTWAQATEVVDRPDNCVYLPGADIKDHAVVSIAYANGVLASLFLAFFGPKAEDQETLELVGTRGRIILTRHTGKLDIVTDYGERHEVMDCADEDFHSTHFGADLRLIRDIRAFYGGAAPVVSARAGLEATRMIMAAHDAIDQGGVTINMANVPDFGA